MSTEHAFRIRIATPADVPTMIPVVNAAFAVETFLNGTRTDEERMSEMMGKGDFLLAGRESGRVVACVYTELRGERGHFGMLAVDPAEQGTGLGRRMCKPPRIIAASTAASSWISRCSIFGRNCPRSIASWATLRPAPRNSIPHAR